MIPLNAVAVIAVVFFSLGFWSGRVCEKYIQTRKFEARVKNNELKYKNIIGDIARMAKDLQ